MNRSTSRGRGFCGRVQAVRGSRSRSQTPSGAVRDVSPATPIRRYLFSPGRKAWQQIDLEAGGDGGQYDEPQEHDAADEERSEDNLGPERHATVQDEDEFGPTLSSSDDEGK